VIDSIDHDGTMSGHDETRVAEILACVSLPTTVLGGREPVNGMRDITSR
jgi:phosphoribosylformimino-5-aminoimidazole carboxamide ribonucleotide (ProFAR) isomerase